MDAHHSHNDYSKQMVESKLDFKKGVLYGREDELNQLESMLLDHGDDRVGRSRVALLHGPSGVGKTSLAQTFFAANNNNIRDGSCAVLIAMGKFHQEQHDEDIRRPFAAIYDSLSELCHAVFIKTTITSTNQEKQQVIRESLGSFLPLLLECIPELAILVGEESSDGDNKQAASEEKRRDVRQQSLAMRKEAISFLLKTISEHCGAVIWFLDDLQWATCQDMDIVNHVVSQSSLCRISFLGSYRDDQVLYQQDNHPLGAWIRKIESNADTVSIAVGTLTVDSISAMLNDLLSVEKDNKHKTHNLARIVHGRTKGNIFLAIQFIRLLHEKGLVHYSRTAFRWEWDCRRILATVDYDYNDDDDASGFLVDKVFQGLHQETQQALRIAACLGSHFENRLVVTLTEMFSQGNNGNNHDFLSEALAASIVMKRRGKGHFQFAHDKFKEAAYRSTAGDKGKTEMHHQIGSALLSMVDDDNRDRILPLATNQLDRSLDLFNDADEKMRLVDLNVRAAKCVINQSAFFPASGFLNTALSLVDECGSWSRHYELKLEILKLLADVRFSIGDLEGCHSAIDEVKQNSVSFKEKLPLLLRELELLGVEEKLQEAIDTAISILRELGDPFPRKATKAHVAMSFLKTRLQLRGVSDERLLNLPNLEDSVGIARLQVYTLLFSFCWLGGQREAVALLALRGMQITLTLGANAFSAGACAGFGFLMCLMEDFESSYRFGRLALRFLERFSSSRDIQPKVMVLVYFYLHGLRKPIHEALEPLLKAHQIGFETGDTQFAEISATAYCGFYLWCGLPLDPVQQDVRTFLVQMNSYRQPAVYAMMQIYLQTILNFSDAEMNNPAILSGEIIDADEMEVKLKAKSSQQALRILWGCKMMLCYFFKNRGQSKRMLSLLWKVKAGGFTLNVIVRTFFCCLAYYDLAVQTGRRKYRKRARKLCNAIRKWVEGGKIVNGMYMLQLIQAEKSILSKDREETKALYEKAISTASRQGFTQLAALANERLGKYMLDIAGDTDEAIFYLTRARTLHFEWGSKAKVRDLDQTYPFLASTSDNDSSPPATYLRGRRRFSAKTTVDMHRGATLQFADPQSDLEGSSFNFSIRRQISNFVLRKNSKKRDPSERVSKRFAATQQT